MITQETKRFVQIEGAFTKSEFTIRAGKKAFKTLISNLYTDKIKAVLTELGANSFDSHIAAGCPEKPFEISLPSFLDPTFSIRDFGVGLSEKFMMTDYTVAFLSSKDASNEYNGEKGLGRLSALSICDSYVCTSFQNGEKREYSVFLNESGVPTILFLGGETTNEPNGFLVSIPVAGNLQSEFERKAKEVYRPYKVKPIVNSDPNFDFPEPTYLLTAPDGSWKIKGSGQHSEALCSVYSYPIDPSAIPDLSEAQVNLLDSGVVLNFNIGEINSAANREGLDYDASTIQSIKDKLNDVWIDVAEQLRKDFDNKTVFEQMALSCSLFSYNGKLNGLKSLTKALYQSLSLPSSLDFGSFNVRSFTHNYRGAEETNNRIIDYSENLVFFYIDKKSYIKNKAKKFFEDGANYGKRMVCVVPVADTAVADFQKAYGVDVSKWTPVSSLPFASHASGSRVPRNKDEYWVLVDADAYRAQRRWQKRLLDSSEEVYYVGKSGYSVLGSYSHTRLDRAINLLAKLGKEVTIVGLTHKQLESVDKFEEFSSFFEEFINDWRDDNQEAAFAASYLKKNYYGFPDYLGSFNFPKNSLMFQVFEEYKNLNTLVSKVVYLGEADCLVSRRSNPAIVVCPFKYSTETLTEAYPLITVFNYNSTFSEKAKNDMIEYIVNKNV